LDGTPFEKKWANDIIGFLQKLLNVAGVTPSGDPDTVLASDYYDSLLEIIDLQRDVFATNGDGYPVVSTTSLNVSSALTINTWESVGPTGSGANNVWTALDVLPSGVKWIEVDTAISASGTPSPSDGWEYIEVRGGEHGGLHTSSLHNKLVEIAYRYFNGESNLFRTSKVRKIPVDSNGMFDLNWNQAATTELSPLIYMHLCGYGF
jgi:hypothetical protein